MELKEQVPMQVTLAAMRILVMVVMLGTVLPSLIHPGEEGVNRPFVREDGTRVSDGGSADGFVFSNAHHVLTIGAYAFIFHHSIPALSAPVSDRKKLLPVYATTIGFCTLGYSLLGIILALYFGANLEASANLNWSDFVSLDSDGSPYTSLTSEFIAAFVVLFPALDVASAFPLNAITLGNSLMSSAFSDPIKYREAVADRFQVSIFRVAAAAPPILAAGIVKDLGALTAWTGLTGLLIIFIFPPILCLASANLLQKASLSAKTFYSSIITSTSAIHTTLVFGAVMTIYCGYCLVAHPPGAD